MHFGYVGSICTLGRGGLGESWPPLLFPQFVRGPLICVRSHLCPFQSLGLRVAGNGEEAGGVHSAIDGFVEGFGELVVGVEGQGLPEGVAGGGDVVLSPGSCGEEGECGDGRGLVRGDGAAGEEGPKAPGVGRVVVFDVFEAVVSGPFVVEAEDESGGDVVGEFGGAGAEVAYLGLEECCWGAGARV
ncbi:hypothetical protein GCM10010276_21700 [Streptomyces longisporus]|uniref:Uncharacterized protein n=1 Tax=Streptomyces longisporus TaxID=1948 RepID=A0ABN3LGD2_STRLO